MPSTRLFTLAVTGWAAAGLAVLGTRAALLGAPISVAEIAVWLFLGLAAPAMVLFGRSGTASVAARVPVRPSRGTDRGVEGGRTT